MVGILPCAGCAFRFWVIPHALQWKAWGGEPPVMVNWAKGIRNRSYRCVMEALLAIADACCSRIGKQERL